MEVTVVGRQVLSQPLLGATGYNSFVTAGVATDI
jgi:hypothetical protein